ncbi:sensor histidine kinase [Streptomyces sp. NPDC004779]|uniref:sensor histidine kinase n=1 Tax=Streptomyces sp. NPDC056049 TaxID=3345693 RepID=UPI0035D9A6E5
MDTRIRPAREVPAPRLARSITVVVLLGYSAITALNILHTGLGALPVASGLACLAIVFAVQVALTSPRARSWRRRRAVPVLLLQGVLTYVPFLWFGLQWGSMEGPLAGSILLTLEGRLGWTLYGAVVGVIPLYCLKLGTPLASMTYFTLSALLTGLVIYGLSRLNDLVHEVHAARGELARMAVSQERLRFARDLHDLLGYSLSAITLKSELVLRLVPGRPDRARQEIASILEVSRRALADVRLVARGYRDMSLAAEAQSAAEILNSAEIRAEVNVDCSHLHPLVDTVLATALREGVTNILRHSKVQTCAIIARSEGDTVSLTLVNDGVPEQAGGAPAHYGDSGGLGNLSVRLTSIGGRFEAGVRPDGRFQLKAVAPITLQLHAAPAASTDHAILRSSA